MLFKRILIISGLLIVIAILLPVLIVSSGKKSIYANLEDAQPANVAIVFGAGLVDQDTPSDALYDRLTVAADLYSSGKVSTILVSGDNRFENYNEPEIMLETLVADFSIPEDAIVADYAGRRTYDTCARAKEIWGVEKAIFVSQGYHLPRAIWTCARLGVGGAGVSASLREYVHEAEYKRREVVAIYKAFLDVYFIHPDYIGGDFIEDIDS
ncbi:MAG: ElyC/SanA/YdcF family protein [bacterium]